MSYAFDTSALSALHRNYYRRRFPTLWEHFDNLVANAEIVSTREVLREIEDSPLENLREWSVNNKELFAIPSAAEGAFVSEIYRVEHFQQNIEKQKLLKGGKNADPFIIARAQVSEHAVVTMELFKAGASKIPNICRHFEIPCLTLEGFMEKEEWQF
tara:strand:- start:2388 stop:2858 length:471 start_codon:yes stop_codon:yes gene_type:complete